MGVLREVWVCGREAKGPALKTRNGQMPRVEAVRERHFLNYSFGRTAGQSQEMWLFI